MTSGKHKAFGFCPDCNQEIFTRSHTCPATNNIKHASSERSIDWGQYRLNGGSYCMAVTERDRYCGRGEAWPGHNHKAGWPNHPFVLGCPEPPND